MAYYSTLSLQPVFYNGALVIGAKIFVYDAGTNTARAAYTNEALTVPHTAPFLTDANGVIPPFWVSAGDEIKVVLKNPDDTVIRTIDGIPTNYGSTPAGRALLTAADAAAQRTALGASPAGAAIFTAADAAAQRTGLGLEGYYGRNRIINGAFDVWQRGTTGTSGYTSADRWAGGGTSLNQSTDVPTGFKYSASLGQTSATYATIIQRIERYNTQDLVGKAVTLSFWAKNSSGTANLAAELVYPNSVDNYSTVTVIQNIVVAASPSTSWTYYTATFNPLPPNITNGIEVRIARQNGASASITLITGVQLEVGSLATPFERRLIGHELMLCQRYFELSSALLGTDSTNTSRVPWTFKVTKRVTPSVNIAAGSSATLDGASVEGCRFFRSGNFVFVSEETSASAEL